MKKRNSCSFSESLAMIFQKTVLCFAFLCAFSDVCLSGDGVLDVLERRELPVFQRGAEPVLSLNLLSVFNDYSDISPYCKDLLDLFGRQYVSYVNCLVPAAQPVKVCQNCFISYENLNNTYTNISSDGVGPGGESCRDTLLRSDRLMVVFLLFSNLEGIWEKSNCEKCISRDSPSLTNDTMYFLTKLNQTYNCFDQYPQGNHSELCKNCKNTYRDLNGLYSDMEKNDTMCIDIEDAMNVTRRRWSKTFNCSFHNEENVAIIAVSSFMLFLPVIFYLSSFLHSEQKKRKLIHPKRAKAYSSLMNIQDKLS